MTVDPFYSLKDNNRYIYHYTSAFTALRHILKNRSFKLSNYVSTNDPRETKAWRVGGWPRNYVEGDSPDLDHLANDVTQRLQLRVIAGCFCSDRSLTGDHLADEHNRGYAKPRMWAQYGDFHKGVCLIFERALFSEAVHDLPDTCFIEEGHVRYYDRAATNRLDGPFILDFRGLDEAGVDKQCEAHAKRRVRELFFEKNTDWSAEEEYRFIAFMQSHASPHYLNFGGALAGIMIGADCEQGLTEEFFLWAHNSGISAARLNWFNGAPYRDLEFETKIRWEIEYGRLRNGRTLWSRCGTWLKQQASFKI
jgi:hypothetical protein